MEYPDAAANPWCYYLDDDDAHAATAAVPTSETGDMIADYSTDDLFELVWGQGRGRSGGAAVGSRFCPPHFESPPPLEGEMVAWLREIDQVEDKLPCDDGGHREPMAVAADQPPAKGSTSTGDNSNKKEKLPTREGMGIKETIRKPPRGGSSSRRSHHGEAHNLTEKRRRHKINEKLKALQQMVPGCDKSNNQASTLDRTIRYMKSLQDQVQAMSVGPAAAVPAAAAAVYPVVPPQYVPPGTGTPVAVPAIPAAAASPMVLGHTPTTVPFRAMLHLPYYPAAVAMPAADVAPLYRYPAAAAPPKDPVIASGDVIKDQAVAARARRP